MLNAPNGQTRIDLGKHGLKPGKGFAASWSTSKVAVQKERPPSNKAFSAAALSINPLGTA